MASLTAKATKRISQDIQNVLQDDIRNQGIFYEYNESDISEGTALIIGPSDTPYEGGFYFFSIKFPPNYPFDPPAMSTLTQDGYTRFNPNMYREGKVCLSLLNTWHVGEKWSGCQTISSILLSILSSVLVAKPLLNEPGFETRDSTVQSEIYNRMILHANLQTAVLSMLQKPPYFAKPFLDTMVESFIKNRNRLQDLAVSMVDYDNKTETMDFFRMTKTYMFSTLGDKLLEYSPSNMITES